MDYAEAVVREAEWLALANVAGVPDLAAANGGPFTTIAPYFNRRLAQSERQLWVMREEGARRRGATAGVRRHDHSFALVVLWRQRNADLAGEMRALDDAVGKLLRRLEGPAGDVSHGGRFDEVGGGDGFRVTYPSADELANPSLDQPGGQAAMILRVTVRYQATDYYPAV
jgi:hypothetical protein